MTYCFGNSHAHFFTDSNHTLYGEGDKKNENFRSFSLGPVIAYNFMSSHFPTMVSWINKLNPAKDDPILLVIGEVDCRWHLPYQASVQKRDPIDVVRECVDRFFHAHLALKEAGYRPIGWGNHPSSTQSHDPTPSDPVFGDCLLRNKISLEWSDYLEEKCKKSGIEFISIIRELINVDGLTKMEYFKDYCHLNPRKCLSWVTERFREKGLLCGVPKKMD